MLPYRRIAATMTPPIATIVVIDIQAWFRSRRSTCASSRCSRPSNRCQLGEAGVDRGEPQVHAGLERVELAVGPFLERGEAQVERVVGDEVTPTTGRLIHQDLGAAHAKIVTR